jgi:hypothetical protein
MRAKPLIKIKTMIQNKLQRCLFFQKWKTGRLNWSCLGISTSGRGEDIRKECGVVEISCTHV